MKTVGGFVVGARLTKDIGVPQKNERADHRDPPPQQRQHQQDQKAGEETT